MLGSDSDFHIHINSDSTIFVGFLVSTVCFYSFSRTFWASGMYRFYFFNILKLIRYTRIFFMYLILLIHSTNNIYLFIYHTKQYSFTVNNKHTHTRIRIWMFSIYINSKYTLIGVHANCVRLLMNSNIDSFVWSVSRIIGAVTCFTSLLLFASGNAPHYKLSV